MFGVFAREIAFPLDGGARPQPSSATKTTGEIGGPRLFLKIFGNFIENIHLPLQKIYKIKIKSAIARPVKTITIVTTIFIIIVTCIVLLASGFRPMASTPERTTRPK